MKTVTLALLMLAPTLASAQTVSEFERGYNAGKASCAVSAPATEFWLCWAGSTEENTFTAATGRTKIEATLALGASTIARHRVDCEAHQ